MPRVSVLCLLPLAACAATDPTPVPGAHLPDAVSEARSEAPASMVSTSTTALTGSGWGDMAIVRDVGRDRYDDVVTIDEASGAARYYRGAFPTMSGTPAKVLLLGLSAGAQVTSAGDVTGDGYNDVLFGDPAFGGGRGRVLLVRGGPLGLASTASTAFIGSSATVGLGAEIAGLGDVNGDGYADVAVAAPGQGRVRVYYGSSSGLSSAYTSIAASWHFDSLYYPASPNTYTGDGIGAAGDANGDGYADLVVSYPHYNTIEGGFYTFFGGPSGMATSGTFLPYPWTGVYSTSCAYAAPYMGWALVGGVDFDGDGYDDLAASAPFDMCDGYVYLWYGSPTGYDASSFSEVRGYGTSEQIGLTLGVGDFDADGYADVAMGGTIASYAEGPFPVMDTSFEDPVTPTSLSGTSAYADWSTYRYVYTNVQGQGDVNGDGYSDVVVSVASSTSTRSVSVYYGAP